MPDPVVHGRIANHAISFVDVGFIDSSQSRTEQCFASLKPLAHSRKFILGQGGWRSRRGLHSDVRTVVTGKKLRRGVHIRETSFAWQLPIIFPYAKYEQNLCVDIGKPKLVSLI